ncbi:DUF2220 domain-containing protein [Alicyclobacillus tolerans]|uniref:Wadjet anti-phage system protein JetD domain-containing protein n=1 Tax=Alicyclobacillus tolerans TaxID=90970 RepID=UPI001F3C03DB|nr:Wadjet anti-phage system protein JetD domain-containing protein [Alicyclobacillus tolerans]MCF8567971.1 DUF2220 domain-containing protein [Alicyclobacillus tolerans]
MKGELLASSVLSALLDKYENSEAFRKGEPTQARIQLRFTDSLVSGYTSGRLDPDDRAVLHAALAQMADRGFIELKWVKFEQGNILERVYLEWERIEDVYEYLGRTPRREELAEFTAQVDQWLKGLLNEGQPGTTGLHEAGWRQANPAQNGLPETGLSDPGLPERWGFLLNWVDDVLSFVCERGRIPSSMIPEEDATRALLLGALAGLVGMGEKSLPVRLFSKRHLGNSKVFEKQVQSHVVRLVRRYWSVGHPLDIEAPDDDATLLLELGIESGHEDITFCGPLRFRYKGIEAGGDVDASVFPFGLGIDASDVHRIAIEEASVSRILTIENKANYRTYVRGRRQSDELVVYLGGFASPAQRQFLRLLREFADPTAVPFHHWGDLDYGGILILQNLKNTCCPDVQAWRMEPSLLDEYRRYLEPIDDAYRAKLSRLLESQTYEWAHPLVRRILELGGTLEQEALLVNTQLE